jgi:hypothetical protein
MLGLSGRGRGRELRRAHRSSGLWVARCVQRVSSGPKSFDPPDAPGKHLESALAVATSDPDGAYSLL